MTFSDKVLAVFETHEPLTFNEASDKLGDGVDTDMVRGAVNGLKRHRGYKVDYVPRRGYYLPLPTPCKLVPPQ